jgi:phenylpropionate dioxygenase-like ring-hydroxylating dioxygenase large terminal subunit
MRHERQVELLQRVADAGPRLAGLHARASMVAEAAAYTDPGRFEAERRVLFRGGPVFVALSSECTEPGSFVTATLGGVPVVIVRQPDGTVRGMVNACRHRGAPLVEGHGQVRRRISCPYHAWTYELDGRLHSRPMSEGAFDDVTLNCDLHRVAVAEQYGMIFARVGRAGTLETDADEPIDVDAALAGAEDDLGAFDLARFRHLESRTNTWKMNWKLILDTFSESYHIRTLHVNSIAPYFNSDTVIYEGFGRNCVSIGLRKNVFDELGKPQDEWSILPYGTIQYFLVPTGLVVHQLDHVEVWRVEPIDVRTTRTVTSVYATDEAIEARGRGYFIKNLDLLLQVTGSEDFSLMERIQANLDSGALPELVYGRNEPPLIHFHRAINDALAGAEH